jgi:hypothetical protein
MKNMAEASDARQDVNCNAAWLGAPRFHNREQGVALWVFAACFRVKQVAYRSRVKCTANKAALD